MAKAKSQPCRIIAIFNQAGGVGKSTSTMNIGYHLATRNHRVLLLDLDPQSSLTIFMGLEPSELDKTVYNAIIKEEPLTIYKQLHKMDLAPANIDLSGAELELVMADLRELRLKEALEPILEAYDFILIDCPPSLGLLSYIALVAATHVLVPIQTQFKAFKGTELLLNTIVRVKKKANKQLALAGFLPTLYAKANSQDTRALKAIEEQMAQFAPILPPVPRSTVLADAAEERIPLALYQASHAATKIFARVARTLEKL